MAGIFLDVKKYFKKLQDYFFNLKVIKEIILSVKHWSICAASSPNKCLYLGLDSEMLLGFPASGTKLIIH